MDSLFADLPEWLGGISPEPRLDRLEMELFIDRLAALPVGDQAIILYMIDRLSGEPAPEYEVQYVRTEDGREGTVHYTWSDAPSCAGRKSDCLPPAPFTPPSHREVLKSAVKILGSRIE